MAHLRTLGRLMEARESVRWVETWRRGRALRRREEWDDRVKSSKNTES